MHQKKHKLSFLKGTLQGMSYYPVMWGLVHKPLFLDPIIKQPGFQWKNKRFFSAAQVILKKVGPKLSSDPWLWMLLIRG